jgi:hypothetical protein
MSKVYRGKVNRREKLFARILEVLTAHRTAKINSYEQHAIFAHELQSTLGLTVVFWMCYCKL